jgi:hypothetical protein
VESRADGRKHLFTFANTHKTFTFNERSFVMKRPAREIKRSHVIATRLTEQEYRAIAAAAGKEQMTDADWLRSVAVGAIAPNPTLLVLTEELLALRMLVTNVVGYLIDDKIISKDLLRSIAMAADEQKKDRARSLFLNATRFGEKGNTSHGA